MDVAIFGSPRMTDEKTVFMGLGKNRSLMYLQQNPYAVYKIMEPGKTLMDWKGIRVYLKMTNLVTSGLVLETHKKQLAKVTGEAAGMIYAGVTFEVTEVLPIIDIGQGWEKSV